MHMQAFTAGEVMTNVNGITKCSKAYTSVQYGIGADDNFDLNSDLVYSTANGAFSNEKIVLTHDISSQPLL